MNATKNTVFDGKALQLPVIRDRFIPAPRDVARNAVCVTGIRCPRCQQREVIYNGNYYCFGMDTDPRECSWALPEDEPHHQLLEKALVHEGVTRTRARR